MNAGYAAPSASSLLFEMVMVLGFKGSMQTYQPVIAIIKYYQSVFSNYSSK